MSRREAQRRKDHAGHLVFRTGSAREWQLAIPASTEPTDATARDRRHDTFLGSARFDELHPLLHGRRTSKNMDQTVRQRPQCVCLVARDNDRYTITDPRTRRATPSEHFLRPCSV